MKLRFLLAALAGVVGALLASSCSMNTKGGGIVAYQAFDRPAFLPAEAGDVVVKVSLSRQRVYVMEGDRMLLAMPVSVGEAATPTPVGNFTIFKKDKRRRAAEHGYGMSGDEVKRMKRSSVSGGWSFRGMPMPFWCEFSPGYGFHTGWVKHSPCTDGSIRMHENLAPKFFRLVSVGTPVSISYRQAEDERWAHMDLPPDAGPLADYPGSMYFGDGYFHRYKAVEFD